MINIDHVNNVVVRDSSLMDCEILAQKLGQKDIEEIWAVSRKTPLEGLNESYCSSLISLTIDNGKPIGMFGVIPGANGKGIIWFVASDEILSVKLEFIRNIRNYIDRLFKMTGYSTFYNYIDARNDRSLKWMKLNGAKFDEPKPFGLEQLPFCYFEFQKKEISKQATRADILKLEEIIKSSPGALIGDNSVCPLTHTFADGQYVREIFIPKGMILVGKIHKTSNPVFVMKGDISIFSEEGTQRFKAPVYLISKPGAKRVGYAHEDTIWVEVIATNETDLSKIEEEVIAKTYEEFEQYTKELKCLS